MTINLIKFKKGLSDAKKRMKYLECNNCFNYGRPGPRMKKCVCGNFQCEYYPFEWENYLSLYPR